VGRPVDAMDAETIKRFADLVAMFNEQHNEHALAVEAATITLSGRYAEVWFDNDDGVHLLRFLPPAARVARRSPAAADR
jgi:hypothetical protein